MSFNMIAQESRLWVGKKLTDFTPRVTCSSPRNKTNTPPGAGTPRTAGRVLTGFFAFFVVVVHKKRQQPKSMC